MGGNYAVHYFDAVPVIIPDTAERRFLEFKAECRNAVLRIEVAAADFIASDSHSLFRVMKNGISASNAKSADLKPDYTLPWLPFLGLTFLLFNSCIAIYRSRDDPWSMAYILVSLIDLLVLFYILRVFERTPRDSSLRGKLKAIVWILTTLLTVMFSYRIGTAISPTIAIMTWTMAAATILGGYYAFFIYKQSDDHRVVGTGDENNR